MTIHITPEPDFSYVSFESNIPLASYSDMIQRVLDTFLPGKFVLTIFANRVCQSFWHYLFLLIKYFPFIKVFCFQVMLSLLNFRHLWPLTLTKNCKKVWLLETGFGKISNTASFKTTNLPTHTLFAFLLLFPERFGNLG